MCLSSVLELHGHISESKSMAESSIQHQRPACSAALVNAIILVWTHSATVTGMTNGW